MRPVIPDGLEEHIEEIYEDEGFATKAEFIRYAVRRELENYE